MDVKRLELLRELAERGSIAAVAKATHRTPSAVSQQLKVLEKEAGVALTERVGRGVVLTGSGRVLAQTATDVAVALERAQAVWADFVATPQGEVTLATFPTGGQMLLPGLLRTIAETPGLTVVATDHDPSILEFADLAADHDVVVAHSPDGRAWRGRGLVTVPLLTEPLDVALPADHRLAGRASLSPGDLEGETWIGVPTDFPFEWVYREIERVTGSPVRVAQRFSDTKVTESLVGAGLGIAVLPRFTAKEARDDMVLLPLESIRAVRYVSVLMRRDRAERPSVRRVVDALRAEASRVAALHGGV
ncbi:MULTISPECIES: LysR family transcriptional regulator [unclassified Frigoribacterium]|jgi:DNA-binding transcriptional LysR family regulator|uniref:LysR family transcriptional regulator n=1 Tax=unclassified Frigoribacterium TaxID=2627005 RepID=UPI000F478820|nr:MULTISPECIES: LysR family transcriptional regulator [unclassified Frigoribacterium]MBD8583838.1 LysR family transcriptional regulator [Frigoribacterium sp. CFBP 8766]MBD8610610.1 LysR family transcriptional regulator [Frigoribacterium sp. CFBP 13729]MBF4579946.1 LysR family transcriptional regulator [Frigoribacterium sp. VKM Ac-2530]MBP1191411.1 DNA-binding transcriptional LysR family regulator [Frigoribacterium sp. PvP032]ROP75946.1 DNA-binding transcriptional LysR family regulator [Frigor